MKKWILKAVVQKTISYFPYKEKVNFLFQKYVTKGVYLDDQHFKYKLDALRDHIKYYKKHSDTSRQDALVLELGTGWYPIVPTMLYLNDFKKTISIDISNWMNLDRQIIAFQKIIEYYDQGLLANYADDINPEKITVLRNICKNRENYTIDEVNKLISLEYMLMDATSLNFKDETFDLICSNNTFEHVYKEILRGILKEFKRVLKRDGVMSHFIDLSDHFAHLDSTINIYHFLRFSKKKWGLIDNSIQPQNRMRWKDYLKMYAELGIEVKEEDYREGSTDLLIEVDVHEEYSEYSPEELAISHGYVIS
jgi:SAM-dependent methyltransferase